MNGNLINWILTGLLAVIMGIAGFIGKTFTSRLDTLEQGQKEIREILIGKGILSVGEYNPAMIDLLNKLNDKVEAIEPRPLINKEE